MKTIDPSIKAAIIFSIICITTIGISIIAFTLSFPKTLKDLLPNTVKFIFHSPPPPGGAYTSWVEVSHETFINLALDFNVTTVFYLHLPPNGTVYTFRYNVYFQGKHDPPAPNVDIYFWTLYEGFFE